MTAKSHIGTCQWCGAEYDKRHIVEGKLRNYRPLYCCRECQRKAKKAKEKARNQKNAAKREAIVSPNIRRNRDDYKRWQIKPGPASSAHCFDCPLMGWVCRSQDYPACRREESYRQLCVKVYDAYCEDRWL